MNHIWRPLAYGFAGVAVVIAACAAPAAWATPGQNVLAQTIPTKTPRPGPVDPTVPPPGSTAEPVVTPPPASTVESGVPTAVVPLGASPTSKATCASESIVTLVADRQAVWPGATVVFTATLTNTGRQPLRQVALEAQLPASLEPGEVVSGAASWQGRALRTSASSLAPGARLAAVYSARVAASLPGQAIVTRASATSTGCAAKTAALTLGLPPSELPATGGSID